MRNLALTKKLTDKFCLFFTDMTYAWAIFPIYHLEAPHHEWPFSKMAAQNACGHGILLTVECKFYGVVLSKFPYCWVQDGVWRPPWKYY